MYMDLKSMAYTAVNEAYNMATKKKPNVNSEFDNESKFKIDAFLILTGNSLHVKTFDQSAHRSGPLDA